MDKLCLDCGKVIDSIRFDLCWSCLGKYRECAICGDIDHRGRMVWDGSKDDAKDVGSDDYGWVCLVCDEARK